MPEGFTWTFAGFEETNVARNKEIVDATVMLDFQADHVGEL